MKKNLLAVCFICAAVCRLFAGGDDLLTGLDAYSRGNWASAAESLKRALVTMPHERTEVLYWLIMTESSAQNYQLALNYTDAFLISAPADERTAEVSYQKGRLLHLSGNYEKSSEVLYRFTADYPDHPKVPSAYYWIGENLYAAGAYPEARKVFSGIVSDYPKSGKVNEAKYKIVLIDQQAVREELLQIIGETNAADSETKDDSVKTEQPLAAADEARSEEDRKRDKEIAERLAALESKIDALTETLSQLSAERDERDRLEQQQELERQQALERQELERQQALERQQQELEEQKQREAEQQALEQRKKDLKELQERTRTLEKVYEQRMKGAK